MKKIALLGDSIRQIGYGPKVPALLGEGYDVWLPEENGRYCTHTLFFVMSSWREHLAGADVIHWNNGLWDVSMYADGQLFTPLDQYVATMSRIADFLLRNAKTVFFATTTPVTAVHPAIKNEDIARYNAAVVPVLREKGLLIDDLNAVVSADIGRYVRRDDNIHLTEDGIAVCAEAVAEAIRKVC